MVLTHNEEFAKALAERLEKLLDESSHPQNDMAVVENLLEDRGYHANGNRESNRAFSQSLFLENQLGQLLDQAQHGPFSPESADTPEELVSNLFPSNGHLE